MTDGGVDEDLEFNTGDFRYIRIASDTKHPMDKWGGYSQDFDEAEHVYTHEDVQESSHDRWGIAGMDSTENINTGFHLLIFDLDLYKTDQVDADDVQVTDAEDVPVVKSQNGGAHLYFALHDPVSESDINLNHDWIDLRGSAVKSHVVAPADIPGCEDSKYDLTNDARVPVFLSVGEVLDRVEIRGEPIGEHDPADPVDVDFARGDAPDEMPDCYHAALSFRSSEAREEHPNAFKIDTFAGLLGLAAGYSVETVTEHFGEYAPFGDSTEFDEQKTRKHLKRLAEKMDLAGMCPPALSTLREHGILKEEESCLCSIPYHGTRPKQRSAPAEDKQFDSFSSLRFEGDTCGYWTVDEETGDDEWVTVANFRLDVLSYLFKEGERLIEMEVHPQSGENSYTVTVPATVFNDTRTFKSNVVTGITTTWEGGDEWLAELRKLIGGQDAPIRDGTRYMGIKPESSELVTPNGVLTADGWTDNPETVYLEKGNTSERAWSLTPDEHTEYDPEHVLETIDLATDMRNSERLLPVLGWLYSTPMRPYIQDWEGQFNALTIVGETGAGKSASLRLLWALVGMNSLPMEVDDTKFALTSALSSSNSIPMWYDEYKPGDMADHEVDRFQKLFRGTTVGSNASRGNPDESTNDYKLLAPVMVSGEQRIQGNAEERRSIQTRFLGDVQDDGSDTVTAFSRLSGSDYRDAEGNMHYPDGSDLEQHALAYYRFVLGIDDDEIRAMWRESREEVVKLLNANGFDSLDNLPQQGIQTIHFGVSMIRQFAESLQEEANVTEDVVPSDAELEEAILYAAKEIGAGAGGRNSHLDDFVELLSRAAQADYLERDTHFTVVNEGQANEELALHLASCHDAVSKYVRDHDVSSVDLLTSASDYKDHMRERSDDAGSYVLTHSQPTTGLNRCARIDTNHVAEALDVNLRAFGLGDEEDSPAKNPESLEDVATAVDDLSNEGNPYTTVTAKVNNWDTDSKHGPEAQGVISDSTGTIDIVDWVGCELDGKAPLEEDELYVLEDVRVSTYKGSLQLEVVDGTTKVENIQEGVGYTGHADSGVNQIVTAVADGGDRTDSEGTDTSDGGTAVFAGDGDEDVEELAERARGKISARFDEGDDVSVPSFALAIDAHPKTLLLAMNELDSDGVVESVGGNVFRYLGGDK
ncbi:hypothetical protein ACERIT_08740 [Halopenitus sp. H-Gu1]|uniref:hypothetical protein n=1 Tax=Halopenitus sp. H-Gu1 TaxID=3242697 RepID=UPI00359CF919